MKYQVFVSYRRDGGEALACLISERLKQRGYVSFYDVESLRSGKFNEEIFRVIDECTDVIVVLPQNGLDRCKNEGDWVRKEVAYAIKAQKNIIPVMMRNFEFPQDLPDDINELKNFHGISANMEYFDAAFDKLVSMLKSTLSLRKETSQSDLDALYKKASLLMQDDKSRAKLFALFHGLKGEQTPVRMTKLADYCRSVRGNALNEDIAKLYSQAAGMGYAPAQTALGDCYCEGVGVETNLERAYEWYCKAAAQELPDAQCKLASFTQKYYEKIALWLIESAALRGCPEAFYKLGECYEYGKGVECNYDLALTNYEKAYDNGYEKAFEKTLDKYWKRKKIKYFFGL